MSEPARAVRRSPRLLLAALLALTAPLVPRPAAAAEAIELELWCDLDPIVQEGTGRDAARLDPGEAVGRLLEEARRTISAMVYGYAFLYTPSDASRAVGELFELEPRAEIPWGDPRLTVADTRLEGERLRALFRYELDSDQQSWREAWRSGGTAKAGGVGSANAFLGFRERGTALTDAIKESIRSYLRPRLFNKPREVRGELLVWEVSVAAVDAGEHHTRVVTRLRVDAVIPYRLY